MDYRQQRCAVQVPSEWFDDRTCDPELDRYVGGTIGEFERGVLDIPGQGGYSEGRLGDVAHLARFAETVNED